MGWLDKAFGKREGERTEEIKVSLSEVESFLRGRMEKDFEPLKDAVKKEHENLQTAANNMQNQLKILEEAVYPEKTYPIIIRKAVGSRKSFVDKMDLLVKNLKKPIGEDINSILSFHEEADKLINVVNLETVKDYASVKILFEKEGKDVVQIFFQIVDIDNRLGNMLKDFRESNLKLLKSKELVADISKLTQELKIGESSELEKTLKKTKEKEKEIEDELGKLPESDEWKMFLEMKRKEEEIKQKMQNKKSELMGCISQLEIPLKKYNWSAKNKVLDCYLQRSLDLILSEDPRGDTLESALRDIKVKILEEELTLKDSEKFLDIINNIIENDTIGKIINEYLKLSEELKKQEERVTSQEILKRKSDLENDMKGLKKEVWELKNEKEMVEKRVKTAREVKEQKLKELETILNSFSDKRILLQAN